jgi:hypothetical protein
VRKSALCSRRPGPTDLGRPPVCKLQQGKRPQEALRPLRARQLPPAQALTCSPRAPSRRQWSLETAVIDVPRAAELFPGAAPSAQSEPLWRAVVGLSRAERSNASWWRARLAAQTEDMLNVLSKQARRYFAVAEVGEWPLCKIERSLVAPACDASPLRGAFGALQNCVHPAGPANVQGECVAPAWARRCPRGVC